MTEIWHFSSGTRQLKHSLSHAAVFVQFAGSRSLLLPFQQAMNEIQRYNLSPAGKLAKCVSFKDTLSSREQLLACFIKAHF